MDFIPQNAPPEHGPHQKKVPVVLSRAEKWQRIKILWAGFAASNIVGLFAVVIVPRLLESLSSMFVPRGQDTFVTVLGVSTFVAIPLSMGAVSAWVWKPLKLPTSHLSLYSVSNTVIAILGSVFTLHEGVICLVMASPLLWLVIWIGCLIGNSLLDKFNKPLQVSLLPLFALCLFIDSRGSKTISEVTSEVTIRATPAKVWHTVNHFSPITAKPNYWLFKLGMPMPVEAKLEAGKVGAKRECILTDNLVFDERVTVWQPREQLTFDITKQPDHPELAGHFKLVRGELRLRDNKDGTVTLFGTSWYRLNVKPLWYWELWSDDVIRQIHLRVMNHIRDEAET